MEMHVDANARRGILLRHGAGRVKHLSVKQLWVQEAVHVFNVKVSRVPREENPADMLTHCMSCPGVEKQLWRFSLSRKQVGEARVCAVVRDFCEAKIGEKGPASGAGGHESDPRGLAPQKSERVRTHSGLLETHERSARGHLGSGRT